jgi:succinyl-diaminopimelate desuccinylase
MTPITTDSLADLLATLVDIPSETGNEDRIAAFVRERLGAVGHGELLNSGKSVVWRAPRPGRPLVVLAGHLDTVPAQGNATSRREGDKLFGVGTSDMKSGDAVMLALAETLDAARLRFGLALVFYDAEEGPAASNGLGRVLSEMPWLREAQLAVLLEPTGLQVELGCNGVMNAEVRVAGKSAHSARPWMGVNAVERAAPWLAEVTRVAPIPKRIHDLEYVETLQVTTLRAGRTRNVVPDELVANLNYRFTPDTSPEEAERALRARVPSEFEFRVVDQAPAGRVSLDAPLAREFVTRSGATLGGKQGWTDVARFTAAGVPAFNFGPGLAELCHQAGEYCPIANLEPACLRLAEFLTTEAP